MRMTDKEMREEKLGNGLRLFTVFTEDFTLKRMSDKHCGRRPTDSYTAWDMKTKCGLSDIT